MDLALTIKIQEKKWETLDCHPNRMFSLIDQTVNCESTASLNRGGGGAVGVLTWPLDLPWLYKHHTTSNKTRSAWKSSLENGRVTMLVVDGYDGLKRWHLMAEWINYYQLIHTPCRSSPTGSTIRWNWHQQSLPLLLTAARTQEQSIDHIMFPPNNAHRSPSIDHRMRAKPSLVLCYSDASVVPRRRSYRRSQWHWYYYWPGTRWGSVSYDRVDVCAAAMVLLSSSPHLPSTFIQHKHSVQVGLRVRETYSIICPTYFNTTAYSP